MPAISTDKLLVALDKSGLLTKDVLDEVRRRVSKAPGKVDPRSVTKYLVQKKHLTVEQGLEFLDGRIPQPADARPAPKRGPAKEDILLADDLEVIEDEDLEVVEDQDLEVVDEDLEVVDDDLEVVDDELDVIDESDLVEAPRSRPPAARPKSKPAAPAKARASQPAPKTDPAGLGPLDAAVATPLDSMLAGGPSLDSAMTTSAVSVPRLGKSKKASKSTAWDSPLLLIGGGALLGLIILGGVLYWSIFRTTGDEALKLAEDDYQSGSYTQAVHKFDKFLQEFPTHKSASIARVHRGLAYMRQVTDGASDWTKALDASRETLDEIASEKEFPQARAELAALLPKIAEGLAEQARKKPDQQLVDRTAEAMALVQKYVAKSLQPGEQMQAVEQSLALTRLQLARGESLAKALTEIQAALATNQPAQAYQVRRELLRIYPDLEREASLQEAILAVSQAEKKDVALVADARPALTDEPQSPILATNTLISRREGSVAGAASRMVFALAEGSAFGLDAATGKVKWRRHVGFDTQLVPRLPARAGATDAVLIDSVRHELHSVEAATGKLRWRQSLGETSNAEPLLLRNRLAVAVRDGRMLLIDAATGNSAGHVKFPHPLTVGPATDSRERRIYQLADHSNLYVISAESGNCEEVIYTGHGTGSISVPPLCVSRYVLIAENSGAKESALRVYLANDDGLSLKLVQSLPMEGHVHVPPQLSGSNTLVVCTDRGSIYAFNVGGTDKKEPLTRVAARPATAEKPTLRFCLARGAELWIADQQLSQYDIQASQGRMAIKWTENVGDVFLQSLEDVGEALVHVRRKQGLPGVAVAAARKSDGKILWETHLAAPLAGNPLLSGKNNVMAMNLVGSGFQIAADADSAIVEAKPADERAIRPAGAGHGSVALPEGPGVFLLGAGSTTLWVLAPGQPPQDLKLPFAAAAAPAVLESNLIVPTVAGEVIVRDVQGQSTLEPFQPKLASGAEIAWQRPTITATGEVLLADGAQHLYRLVEEAQPRPHLALKATAELIRPIATAVAVTEQTAFAGDANGRLSSFALPMLNPGEEWNLGSPIAWGPVSVGDTVLVSTRNNQLFCFEAGPKQRWQTTLDHGPLAGDPVVVDGKIVLTSRRGTVWSINPADGQEVGRADLGQPLSSSAMAVGEHLIVAGLDGVLHRIAKP